MKKFENQNIVKIAIEHGCKTAKDLAKFIKEFNIELGTYQDGRSLA
jgi:hypothetical protein